MENKLLNIGRADEHTATVWLSDESKWTNPQVQMQAKALCDDLCKANLVSWARILIAGKKVYQACGTKA